MRELPDATPLLHDPAALRERFDRDGCLLLRGLIGAESVNDLGGQVLALLSQRGWTSDPPDWADPHAGRFSYHIDVQRLEAFHALAHDPALFHIARSLLGEDVFVHPRRVLRTIWPLTRELTTPPHQDFLYIRGAAETLTVWVPLGACPREQGGLRVLLGSHRAGELPVHLYEDSFARFGVAVAEDDPRWATTDYAAGDALAFHSFAVHSALPNCSGPVRLSVDYRYQSTATPVAWRSLRPAEYPGIPDWPELLAGVPWSSELWLSLPESVRVVD